MKRIILQIALLVVVVLVISQSGAYSWNIMTEELPPFNFTIDGKVHGISTDILLELMQRNGTPVLREDIQMKPWPRAYNTVLTTPDSILFSAARTDERETLFKWVGPIQTLTIGLNAKKSNKIRINSIEDVHKYRIGTIRNGAPEQLVIKAGVEEDALDRISDPAANIKKLQSGRIDLFAFNVPTTRYLMLSQGIDPDQYEVVYVLKEADLYYAFHKSTDDEIINALNDTLLELKKNDGTGSSVVDRIVSRYLNANN